jgi:hypothetical protein
LPLPVGSIAGHLETFALEQTLQTLTKNLVIVGEQDSSRHVS